MTAARPHPRPARPPDRASSAEDPRSDGAGASSAEDPRSDGAGTQNSGSGSDHS